MKWSTTNARIKNKYIQVFFKYKITICPNLALYFAENEELLVVSALAICIKNEAGSALFLAVYMIAWSS